MNEPAQAEPRQRNAAEATPDAGTRTTQSDRAGTLPAAFPEGVTTIPPPVSSGFDTIIPTSSAAPLRTSGMFVSGHEILGELGRGGMGVVYKARQAGLNRVVALKMILAGSHASAHELFRFRAEAEAVARLQHPHIVQIYEVGEHEGLPYFSLEFCAAGSLASKTSGTPLPPQWAAEMVETLARAVHVAHQHGIVHRDLKPANVLVTADGTPKLTDFGLAKKLNDTGQTASGAILGTPSYMAPEQAQGKTKEIGPATDVYGLGAILYEFLTGRPPFLEATSWDTLAQVIHEEPVPPGRLQSGVPRDLETICLKCLEKDPRARYASAEALADDLASFQRGEDIAARPLSIPGRLARWTRRRPALAGTFLALLFFYTNHQVLRSLGLGIVDAAFNEFVTWLLLAWAAAATAFQWLSNRPGWRTPATFGWAALDVLLLTALILKGAGPRSSLIPAYLLLVAAAGLRFRVDLVWFVTVLCLLSYTSVDLAARWYRPDATVPVHVTVFLLISLALMGLSFHLVLGRVREIKSAQL